MGEMNISAENLAFFRIMCENFDGYLYLCDVKSNISIWSENAILDFELPGGYMSNVDAIWSELIHPDDREMFRKDIANVLSGKVDRHMCEYRAKNRAGEYVWLKCRGSVLYSDNGKPKYFMGAMTNIGVESKIDVTTSLFSVYEFYNDIKLCVEKNHEKGGLMFIDIDNFKTINDKYSFTFGNAVLKAFANILGECCSKCFRIYRLEGDKFAIIMLNATKKTVQTYFERISGIAQNSNLVADKPISFTVSGGACLFPDDGSEYDVLYKNLDYALSKSKLEGKNRLTFFSKELLEKHLYMIELLEDLKEGVKNNFKGFELYYQPLFKNSNGLLYGGEALLRWKSDKFDNVYPSDFIPLLEDNGYIYDVGLWVVENALIQTKAWREIYPDFKMNVNASYKQFENSNFISDVLKLLDKLAMPASSLIIELTESCNVKDFSMLKESLECFRNAGIEVALDDFGTGYSSIAVLRELPTDWVKIDHSFVAKIMNNAKDEIIIKHIISLCSALGITVCVEGIENYEICSVIREYEPDILQGYYYSVPVPAIDFEEQFL